MCNASAAGRLMTTSGHVVLPSSLDWVLTAGGAAATITIGT
jgi:hypothetical protein